jgi:hypothetical protein
MIRIVARRKFRGRRRSRVNNQHRGFSICIAKLDLGCMRQRHGHSGTTGSHHLTSAGPRHLCERAESFSDLECCCSVTVSSNKTLAQITNRGGGLAGRISSTSFQIGSADISLTLIPACLFRQCCAQPYMYLQGCGLSHRHYCQRYRRRHIPQDVTCHT